MDNFVALKNFTYKLDAPIVLDLNDVNTETIKYFSNGEEKSFQLRKIEMAHPTKEIIKLKNHIYHDTMDALADPDVKVFTIYKNFIINDNIFERLKKHKKIVMNNIYIKAQYDTVKKVVKYTFYAS